MGVTEMCRETEAPIDLEITTDAGAAVVVAGEIDIATAPRSQRVGGRRGAAVRRRPPALSSLAHLRQ